MNTATKYTAWVAIRQVMAGHPVTLADGTVLTRESVMQMFDLAPDPAGSPIRAVESRPGHWQPSPALVDELRRTTTRDLAQRPGATIQIGC